MAISTEELFKKSLALNEADRVSLAALILDSVEPTDLNVQAEWEKEIEVRLSELDSGAVQTIPWESVRARLSGKLKAVAKD